MPQERDTMSIPDATTTLLMLAGWAPPEGLTVTVSCSCYPEAPGERAVNVVLSAVEDQFCVIRVAGVPDAAALGALREAGRLLLEAAWDQPACLPPGLGPDPGEAPAAAAGLPPPAGPLDRRSSPHPLYDTTRFGRDD